MSFEKLQSALPLDDVLQYPPAGTETHPRLAPRALRSDDAAQPPQNRQKFAQIA